MKYWGGPYDGAEVSPFETGKPSVKLPVLPQVLDTGRTVFPALGAFEGYQWVAARGRFEWRGTFTPGRVDR